MAILLEQLSPTQAPPKQFPPRQFSLINEQLVYLRKRAAELIRLSDLHQRLEASRKTGTR